MAPRFNGDGSVRAPARVTVLRNGVSVQDHTELRGPTAYIGQPPYEKHPFRQALLLQEHGNPVSFRNIWIRELNEQALFNGRDLAGWYPFLEKRERGQDAEGVFRVENGVLHISGAELGYLATEESFANYDLRGEFKWGGEALSTARTVAARQRNPLPFPRRRAGQRLAEVARVPGAGGGLW